MEHRLMAGLAFGLIGLVAGVAASVASVPALAALAGACAVGAAVVVVQLTRAVRKRERDMASVQHGLALLQQEVGQLQEAAAAGRDAVRVAGTFAEMVAMRNIELTRQAEGGLLDFETGLLDGRYFPPALQSRVAAARRLLRPLSIVLLELDLHSDSGEDQQRQAMAALAGVLRTTLRESDTACRINEARFGLILEDTPEGGGVWAAERVRTSYAQEGGEVQHLSAGVAAYPSHALEAEDLLAGAEQALERARASGRGQVEVAPVD